MRDLYITCSDCAVWSRCGGFLRPKNSLGRCRYGDVLMIHDVNDDDGGGDVCAWGQASSLSFADLWLDCVCNRSLNRRYHHGDLMHIRKDCRGFRELTYPDYQTLLAA